MRVDELLRSLLKRPLALLMILAVAAGGAYVGFNRATSTYESSASVLIVPPGDTAAGDATGNDNPFTQLDYSIAQLALVVGSQLESDAVREQVVSVGGDGSYTATTLSSDNSAVAQLSPIVKLTATSATAGGAQQAIRVLVDQAGDQLAAVQSASNVPAESQAQVVVSTPATASAVVGNPQVRSAGVFGIAAGFAVLLLLVALQPIFGGRRPAGVATQPAPSATPARRGTAADRRPGNQVKRRGPIFHDRRAGDAGRFAAPLADAPLADERRTVQPAVQRVPAEEPRAPQPASAPMTQRRQEVLRQMVREDWQRSGSNVPWSRREQREAYQRAEERLAEKQRQRRTLDESVSRVDDFLEYRDHG